MSELLFRAGFGILLVASAAAMIMVAVAMAFLLIRSIQERDALEIVFSGMMLVVIIGGGMALMGIALGRLL